MLKNLGFYTACAVMELDNKLAQLGLGLASYGYTSEHDKTLASIISLETKEVITRGDLEFCDAWCDGVLWEKAQEKIRAENKKAEQEKIIKILKS
jgi:hypothetical protein